MHLNTWNTFQTSLSLSLRVTCQTDVTPVALIFFLNNKSSYLWYILFCGLTSPLLLWTVIWLILFAVDSVKSFAFFSRGTWVLTVIRLWIWIKFFIFIHYILVSGWREALFGCFQVLALFLLAVHDLNIYI